MAIFHANITLEQDGYDVHLQDEDQLYFTVPTENDGSDNWARLQAWLDEGNVIVDDIDRSQIYKDQRRVEYPSFAEQMDYIYHNGVEAWKTDMIDPIKAKYPKPS